MMKSLRFIVCFVLWVCCVNLAMAEDGGRVILDLKKDNDVFDNSNKETMSGLVNMAANYWQDVKEYDELLVGESVNKDFSADIMAKYPDYSQSVAEDWQKYVRKGIKGYRFYKDMKQKLIDWVMNQEMPLVVDDDQYEMGGDEVYIESDKPVVVKKFKKVVAYSDNPREQLSVKEKLAKDLDIERPSDKIAKYKKALIERDWETLFLSDWKNYIQSIYNNPTGKSYINKDAAAAILTRFDGVDQSGKIAGTIEVKTTRPAWVLLSKYEKYDGIKVNFDRAENFDLTKMAFAWPQLIEDENGKVIAGYSAQFPIYFEGKAKNTRQNVNIRADVAINVCLENSCKYVELKPEVVLKTAKEISETSFASYIETVRMNTPNEKNADNFEFDALMLEEKGDEKFLILSVNTDDNLLFNVLILGEEAEYFAKPQLSVDKDSVVARFRLIDENFSPQNKNISFWVVGEKTNQYVHTMKVDRILSNNNQNLMVAAKVFLGAWGGGLLLNLMPFGLLMLLIKFSEIAGFGGKNKQKIRADFGENAAGILVGVLLMMIWFGVRKTLGDDLSWAMQSQNVYVKAVLIWLGLVAWLYVAGGFGFVRGINGNFKVELGQGIGLALVSMSLPAPYVGNAFCVASSYGVGGIAAFCLCLAVGLAMPYGILAIYPEMGKYVPAPGVWMKKLRTGIGWLLALCVVWMLADMAEKTASALIWRWLVYVVAVAVIVFFRKVFLAEVDKLEDLNRAKSLRQRGNKIFGGIVLAIMILSLVDVGRNVVEKQDLVLNTINRELIDENIKSGNKVLIKIEADWCLACRFNNALVFNTEEMESVLKRNNVTVWEIDGTKYKPELFDFMQKFGRVGAPFYVLFSPRFSEGLVLPEIVNTDDLKNVMAM